MDAPTQVHLGECVQAERLEQVHQDPDVHPVRTGEGDRLESLSRPGVLAGQRLHEPGQGGPVGCQQRSGDEFGHPAPVRGQDGSPVVQRTLVGALAEHHPGLGEQRAQQAGRERGVEIAQVGVEKGDHITVGGGEGLPQRLALARDVPQSGQHVPLRHHPGAGRAGHLRRAVDAVGVDHHQLVDEGHPFDQLGS